MSYRTILVEVDDSEAGKARAAMAVATAARFKASITGVFLKTAIIPAFMIGDGFAITPGDVIQQYLDDRGKETTKTSAALRVMFEALARGADCPCSWLDVNGDSEDELIACARRHDLSILPATMKAALGSSTLSAARVGMASGAPMLIAPKALAPNWGGRRVLVAWKEAREPARVLNDAWPFLTEATEVTFLTVSKNAPGALDTMLQRQLKAHGCKPAQLIVAAEEDLSAADVIRYQIARTGADLAVLGLFGHSRLQEFVLGGVSRNLLADAPVPMLVSH